MRAVAWPRVTSAKCCLLDILETGEVRHKDETHLWIAKHYPDRADNSLCAVVVLEAAVVVKTVMHHFSWESGS